MNTQAVKGKKVEREGGMQPIMVKTDVAAKLFGVSENKLRYRCLREPEVMKARKIGKYWYIPYAVLLELYGPAGEV